MSEKLKSTVENAVDTRELADLNREKAAEIERSLEKAVEKEKSNAENENSIKHEAIEIAARQEKRQEQKESKEIKEDKPLTKKDIEILRKAYNNYTVPVDYLSVDVKNLMFYEGLSKSQAINKILTFISNT